MNFVCKSFQELTKIELYEILKVRAQIFVVEQNCVYQDLDDLDYRSFHLFYEMEGKIQAYLRVFEKDSYRKIVQIGRVLTVTHGKGFGGKLLQQAIPKIKSLISFLFN